MPIRDGVKIDGLTGFPEAAGGRYDLDKFLAALNTIPLEDRREACMAENARILTKLGEIRQQLANTKAGFVKTGEHADPDWWAKANGAQRFFGFVTQRLQEKLATLPRKRVAKIGQPLGTYFMDVAREVLPREQFYNIADAAGQRRANAEGAA